MNRTRPKRLKSIARGIGSNNHSANGYAHRETTTALICVRQNHGYVQAHIARCVMKGNLVLYY